MAEVLGVSPLGNGENFVFRRVDDLGYGILLAVRRLSDIPAGVDELTQNALFLDDLGVVLDIEGAGHCLADGADIVLAARLIVNAFFDKHIDEGDDIDLTVEQKQLVHGKIDLLVRFLVEVIGADQIRDLVERGGVDEYRAQKRLLRDQREGELLHDGIIHDRKIPSLKKLFVGDKEIDLARNVGV